VPGASLLFVIMIHEGPGETYMSHTVTDLNFTDFVSGHAAMLSFTSPWCAACKKVHDHLDRLEGAYPAVSFGTMDISTSPNTPAGLKVLSIPTVIFFRQGRETGRLSGNISDADLRNRLDTLV